MQLSISVDSRTAVGKLSSVIPLIDRTAKEFVEEGAEILKARIKDNVDNKIVNRRTGKLWRSIRAKINQIAGGWEADIGSGLDYSYFLEYGTERMTARKFIEISFLEEEDKLTALATEKFEKIF